MHYIHSLGEYYDDLDEYTDDEYEDEAAVDDQEFEESSILDQVATVIGSFNPFNPLKQPQKGK